MSGPKTYPFKPSAKSPSARCDRPSPNKSPCCSSRSSPPGRAGQGRPSPDFPQRLRPMDGKQHALLTAFRCLGINGAENRVKVLRFVQIQLARVRRLQAVPLGLSDNPHIVPTQCETQPEHGATVPKGAPFGPTSEQATGIRYCPMGLDGVELIPAAEDGFQIRIPAPAGRPRDAPFEETPHGLTIRNHGNGQVPYFLCC